MPPLATRAASLLLMLAVALCFTTSGHAEEESWLYAMYSAVSGSTFFWKNMLEDIINHADVMDQFSSAIQDDLQAAAGKGTTVTYRDMLFNASSAYLKYWVLLRGPPPTKAELESRIAASATFSKLSAFIAGLSRYELMADLIPKNISVVHPLIPDPNPSSSSPDYPIVDSVGYDVAVLFSGTPSVWTSVLASHRSAVSADIVAAVQLLMDSSKLRNDVVVSEMYVLAASSEKKTMGSGAGGLVARLSIVSSATTAMTGRHLSASEYVSALLSLNTTALTAIFQASSGSPAPVLVEATMVGTMEARDECGSTCKGVAAMAAVLVLLALACVAITCIAVRCPCGCVRTPREDCVQNLKWAAEGVEAINVYGDEFASMPVAPAVVGPSLHVRNVLARW